MLFSDYSFFITLCETMLCLALVVFLALLKVRAPYGMLYSSKWGPSLSNRAGWILMELPAFLVMLLIWLLSPRASEAVPMVFALLFLLHYFQRTFIFPLLMRGKSRMPFLIMLMGIVFNSINAYLLGAWFFWFAPADLYTVGWFATPQFIIGTLIFFIGMGINLQSDYIVRHLRKPGDTRHYIPRGGMYRYVAAANYFGELTEWAGYALLTWSLPGAVFLVWTFANLAPRAIALNRRYCEEFGDEYRKLNRRNIIPFIF